MMAGLVKFIRLEAGIEEERRSTQLCYLQKAEHRQDGMAFGAGELGVRTTRRDPNLTYLFQSLPEYRYTCCMNVSD